MDQDIERLERESNKSTTKNLHAATKSLGRAQKTLSETLEARKAHRTRWTKHITEAITTWENQLHEYRKQQAVFQEVAAKARADIESARTAIQSLSTGANPAALAALPVIPPAGLVSEQDDTAEADKEEEALQTQLHTVLQSCAASLGLQPTKQEAAQDMLDLTEDEDKEEGRQSGKRPRSLEPCPAPASGPSAPAKEPGKT